MLFEWASASVTFYAGALAHVKPGVGRDNAFPQRRQRHDGLEC